MSEREDIAGDIITKLDAVSSRIELKMITREQFRPLFEAELTRELFDRCLI